MRTLKTVFCDSKWNKNIFIFFFGGEPRLLQVQKVLQPRE